MSNDYTENEVDSNYQCGVCGKLFSTEHDIDNHIRNDHGEPDCLDCSNHLESRMLLEKRIGEQDKKISDLTVNN